MASSSLAELLPYLLSGAAASVLCILLVRMNRMEGFVGRSDRRRYNELPIPKLGGAAVAGGLFAGIALFVGMGKGSGLGTPLSFFFSAIGVTLASGLLDDTRGIRWRWKRAAQLAGALALVLAVDGSGTPMERLFGLSSPAARGLELLWCLLLLNSFSLADGLDELAGGLALIALTFLCVAGSGLGGLGRLGALALPAMLAFHLWNRHPARIYLGEAGAEILAAILFVSSMSYARSPSAAVDLAALLFVFALPVGDTVLAVHRRLRRGKAWALADREHLHHRLARLGLSSKNAARSIHAVAAYLAVLAYAYGAFDHFSPLWFFLGAASPVLNYLLLRAAERKLYTQLSNFASHMLREREERRNPGREPEYAGELCFRIDLSFCVRQLLEKNPGRIQHFYQRLGSALKGRGSVVREVSFESSRVALVRIAGPEVEAEARISLRDDLERFEKAEKLSFGLEDETVLRRYGAAPDRAA